MAAAAGARGAVAAEVRGMAEKRRQHDVQAAQARKRHVHQGQQSHLRRQRACRIAMPGYRVLEGILCRGRSFWHPLSGSGLRATTAFDDGDPGGAPMPRVRATHHTAFIAGTAHRDPAREEP